MLKNNRDTTCGRNDCINVFLIDFIAIASREIFIPPAVDPLQLPHNINNTNIKCDGIGQLLTSCVTIPVVVAIDTTWNIDDDIFSDTVVVLEDNNWMAIIIILVVNNNVTYHNDSSSWMNR